MSKRVQLFVWMIVLGCSGRAVAQDAVPGEILQRTIMIRTPTEQGTGFSIDYQGKLYLVTARHVLSGQAADSPNIQVRQNGQWVNLKTKKILYPKSDEVDIAVVKTDEDAPKRFGVAMAGKTGGVVFGQQVWFLGYPFIEGLSSHLMGFDAPFIKRGTMSALVATNPDAIVLYIDGFNNAGFSGGPIICWDFTDRVYKIIGVVKGYKPEAAKIMVNGQPVDTNLLVNSGILVGYSIDHAIQAIESDQDGKK
jgi:hypothetical protein